MNNFWIPTHDSQSSSLAQLAFDTLKHLQPRAIQLAAVDGAVSRADPVKLLGVKVNGETWTTEERA